MLVSKENITTVLPHRAPVLMIDNLVSFSEHSAVSDFFIEKDNVFVRDGEFMESGIIENMAQTIAAGAGWLDLMDRKHIPLAYIGAVSRLKISRYPLAGDLLKTQTKLLTQALNIYLFSGKVFLGEELIAECEMKVAYER